MSNQKNLTLEFGLDMLLRQRLEKENAIQTIERLKESAQEYGIELAIEPYAGINSKCSGGRSSEYDAEALTHQIHSFNDAGIAFALALNGRLTMTVTHFHKTEQDILEVLNTNSNNGIENKAIITNDTLREICRHDYPHLKIVASCIKHTDPLNQVGYDELFSTYDLIVPVNQHSTPVFLEPYSEHADQMLLLLNSRCGRADLAYCYADYAQIEFLASLPEGTIASGDAYKKNYFYHLDMARGHTYERPSQLRRDFGCDSNKAMLINRSDDLAGFIEMGVHRFKIARQGTHLTERQFGTLFSMFLPRS